MKTIDKIIYYNSILIIIIPILLFWIFFTRIYISIPMCILTLYLTIKVLKKYEKTNYNPNKKYWIIASLLIFIWIIFSGIGGFSFQNEDFLYRNAMIRDLINYSWPVKYNNYGLVYYFTYFLPAALIGKITSFKVANIVLFIYSYISILCILYLINRYLKKDSIFSLLLLILFSGLDILMAGKDIFSLNHIEWYIKIFQYSSNTTLIYWVFNQAIPIWLIITILLNMKNNKNILFISSLSFLYSPFATLTIIPIAIYLYLKNTNNILKNIFSFELLYAIFEAIIIGSFYLSGNGVGDVNFLFNMNYSLFILLIYYIVFILIEIGLYVIPTFKYYKNDKLYIIIVLLLLIIPFFVITINYDFIMRASIPPLFILMIYFINYLENNKKNIIIYILLVFSFMNPLHELGRSIYYTFTKNNYIADDIISIGNPKTCKKKVKYELYGNLNSFYYKYFSK